MATKTPEKPEESIHGEEEKSPAFPINENPSGVYDSSSTESLSQIPTASQEGIDHLRKKHKGGELSGSELKDKEQSASAGAKTSIGAEEKGLLGKAGSGLYNPAGAALPPQAKLAQMVAGVFTTNRRKKAAAGGVIGMAIALGFMFFAVVQGPLQFVHLAQTLQKHFKSNEDFGNDRTSKMLIYAVIGRGAENGRLGITGNYAANKWEDRLLKETGMRPVYSEGTRRFVGFEIVDENKAQRVLGDISEKGGRGSKSIERAMGNGAEINKGSAGVVRPGGEPLDGSRRFIDLSKVKFADRRQFVRTIGRATSVNNIASEVGSRLLIKRGGVDFHPMNKVKKYGDDSIAKYLEKRRKRFEEGTKPLQDVTPKTEKDAEGNDYTDKADVDASNETKSYVDNFLKSGVFRTTTSAAIITGVLCSAKSYGDNVTDYKFENVYKPMVRLGFESISTGSQVQAMRDGDFNLNALRIRQQFLYDKESGTSWNQAEAIRADQGKEGGVPMPKEAKLSKIDDKPQLFDIIDGIPGLSTVCGAQAAVMGLPVIKQVSGVIQDAATKGIDAALGIAGTSTADIMEASLKVVAGKSVDPDAKGANFGNLASAGAFMAANEQAIATGGRPLSDGERQNLALYEKQEENFDNSTRSFAERYFNPYNSQSVVGTMISQTPSNIGQMSMTSGIASLNFSSLSGFISNLIPRVHAASGYDYGVPKYGFSLGERSDDTYENPYANAQRDRSDDGQRKLPPLEDDNELKRLNEEYGKPCFGVEVTTDDKGVHVNQVSQVNIFKVQKEDKCDYQKNRADRFNQYRMYIADSMTAMSLACYEGDEDYCNELGFSGANASSDGSSEPLQEADVKIDKSQLGKNSDKLKCADGTKDLGVVTTKYTGELKKEQGALKIRLCQVKDIPGNGDNTEGVQKTGGATVDARVSAAWAALGKAAKADGITLEAGSSFRLADSCGGTGDGTACARPGKSFHQTGLAIDFGNGMYGTTGSSTTSCSGRAKLPGNKAWKWLHDNAEKFGIEQYTYEAWHWDPSGLANRCDKSEG